MNHPLDIKRIPISCVRTIEFVLPEHIVRIEGMENYSKVYINDREPILSNNNIGFYKAFLSDFHFISCHRSHIINPDFIIRYHKEGYVEMVGNDKIPIARRKKKEFIESVIKESFRMSKVW